MLDYYNHLVSLFSTYDHTIRKAKGYDLEKLLKLYERILSDFWKEDRILYFLSETVRMPESADEKFRECLK